MCLQFYSKRYVYLNMYRIVCLCIVLNSSSAQPTIQVPTAGNCDDDTVLTCVTTGTVPNWKKNLRIIVSNGNPASAVSPVKYIQTITSTSVLLTIKNTQITDGDTYTCAVGFDDSPAKTLRFECKAKTASASVAQNKKLTIDIPAVYPAPSNIAVHVGSPLVGSYSCSTSSTIPSYFDCLWTSTSSLEDGEYTYSVTVTTVTTSSQITGNFKIATASAPTISNIETISNNRPAVRGAEDKSITITCTSIGGIPAPTLAWYRTNVSTTPPLASTNTGVLQGDDTYTVTLSHTFTTSRATYDLKTFNCRSYYPGTTTTVTQGSRSSSVLMYLYLKPSAPTLTQTNTPTTGGTVTVECRTTNCRPAAVITFKYNSQKITPVPVVTPDTNTETFTVVSTFQTSVTATDNGNSVKCSVTHRALDNALERNTDISVRFPVSLGSTSISGNREFTATGSSRLTLTCTTGSSNPASDITWRNGSTVITSTRPYTPSSGSNNGVIRSQELWLQPDRSMHGDTIVCSVTNVVTQTAVVGSVNLNLKYHPIVSISTTSPLVVTEGDTTSFIPCTADSRPTSTFTWYRDNTQIDQASPGTDRYNYNFSTVARTNYGQYKCRADNGVSPTSEAQISVQIQFKPNTVSITGNQVITANTINTLTLTCSSGTSNPIANISWNVGNVPVVRYNDLSDQNGDYGGKIKRQQVIIKPTRDHDGAILICTASNLYNGNNPASNSETLTLNYNPVIISITANEPTEGQTTPARLRCEVTSNPASSFKWYRGNSLKEQSNGGVSNNVYEYVISNVNRGHGGTYRCETDNNINPQGTGTVALVVKYKPDVTVSATNKTVSDPRADIICSPTGVPARYTFNWRHTWYGQEIQHTTDLGNQATLQLQDLSYQLSGKYTCIADNGVSSSNNPEAGSGYTYFEVKSYPIITFPNIREDPYQLSASLNTDVNITIQYYTNADVTNIKLYNASIGGEEVQNFKHTTSDANVNLTFFNKQVLTPGKLLTLSMSLTDTSQFGFYKLDINNVIGNGTMLISLSPESPPETPTLLRIDESDITEHSVTVSWIRGYHGGFDQTFVIQWSDDDKSWNNISIPSDQSLSKIPLTVTIESLVPSTEYYIRVFAMNEIGSSQHIQYGVKFTTLEGVHEPLPQSSSVSGIVGGVVGGVVVIVGIVILIVLARKYKLSINVDCAQRKESGKEDDNVNGQYENVKQDNDNKQTDAEPVNYYNLGNNSKHDHAAYESLTERSTEPSVYSSLQNIEMAPTRNIASNPALSEPIQSQYESLTEREADPNMYSSLDNTKSSPDGKDALNPEEVYINLKI